MLYSLTFSKIIEYLFPFEMITVVIKQVSDDAVIQPQSLIFHFKVKFLHLLVFFKLFEGIPHPIQLPSATLEDWQTGCLRCLSHVTRFKAGALVCFLGLRKQIRECKASVFFL